MLQINHLHRSIKAYFISALLFIFIGFSVNGLWIKGSSPGCEFKEIFFLLGNVAV